MTRPDRSASRPRTASVSRPLFRTVPIYIAGTALVVAAVVAVTLLFDYFKEPYPQCGMDIVNTDLHALETCFAALVERLKDARMANDQPRSAAVQHDIATHIRDALAIRSLDKQKRILFAKLVPHACEVRGRPQRGITPKAPTELLYADLISGSHDADYMAAAVEALLTCSIEEWWTPVWHHADKLATTVDAAATEAVGLAAADVLLNDPAGPSENRRFSTERLSDVNNFLEAHPNTRERFVPLVSKSALVELKSDIRLIIDNATEHTVNIAINGEPVGSMSGGQRAEYAARSGLLSIQLTRDGGRPFEEAIAIVAEGTVVYNVSKAARYLLTHVEYGPSEGYVSAQPGPADESLGSPRFLLHPAHYYFNDTLPKEITVYLGTGPAADGVGDLLRRLDGPVNYRTRLVRD